MLHFRTKKLIKHYSKCCILYEFCIRVRLVFLKLTNAFNYNQNDPNVELPAVLPSYVASCGRDKLIKIFDATTGNCIMTLVDHDNWVRGVIFHPNGRHIISVSDDRTIRVWDLRGMDSHYLSSHFPIKLTLQFTEQRCVRTIADAHENSFVQCLDFNPRNPHLVTGGGQDHAVILWACR